MAHTVSYNSTSGMIEVKIHGDYGPVEARQVVHEVKDAIKEFNSLLVFVDASEIEFGLSAVDILNAPQTISDAFIPADISMTQVKRAVVIKKGIRDSRFLENVVVNRGHVMKLFQDADEAKAWLLE